MGTYFKPGCWNVICSLCGKVVKSDEIKKRWDGLLVCTDDYDTRHPMDLLKAIPDNQSVPFVNPEPTDTYVEVVYLSSAIAYYAIAGFISGLVVEL